MSSDNPSITVIAIVARDGAIGRGGDQPFHIREDFRRFKALTMGRPIIMGRRTFEALPKGALPGRRNIVVSRNADYHPEGAERVGSIEEAVEMCRGVEEIMIIGGGQIYRQAMPLASQLLITEVDATVPDADTFFPAIDADNWIRSAASETFHDDREHVNFAFLTYTRR